MAYLALDAIKQLKMTIEYRHTIRGVTGVFIKGGGAG